MRCLACSCHAPSSVLLRTCGWSASLCCWPATSAAPHYCCCPATQCAHIRGGCGGGRQHPCSEGCTLRCPPMQTGWTTTQTCGSRAIEDVTPLRGVLRYIQAVSTVKACGPPYDVSYRRLAPDCMVSSQFFSGCPSVCEIGKSTVEVRRRIREFGGLSYSWTACHSMRSPCVIKNVTDPRTLWCGVGGWGYSLDLRLQGRANARYGLLCLVHRQTFLRAHKQTTSIFPPVSACSLPAGQLPCMVLVWADIFCLKLKAQLLCHPTAYMIRMLMSTTTPSSDIIGH